MSKEETKIVVHTEDFIKDLDGKDTELTIGKALGNIVLAVKSDPLRSYLLAQSLNTWEPCELSKSDLDFVKSAVKDQGVGVYGNALVAGQLIYMLNKFEV